MSNKKYNLVGLVFVIALNTTLLSAQNLFIEEIEQQDISISLNSVIKDRIIRIDHSALNPSINVLQSQEVVIGLGLRESVRSFQFKEQKIFSDNFSLKLASGKKVKYDLGKHYSGRHEDGSLIAVSLFENGQVHGLVIDRYITYNIEPILYEGIQLLNLYRLVVAEEFPDELSNFCHTEDGLEVTYEGIQQEDKQPVQSKNIGIVDLHLECDFKLYQDLGSDATVATDYVTGLMNVVFSLFSNEGVTIQISELIIWDILDPFGATVQGTTTSVILGNFRSYYTCTSQTYNGRIAHLLSTTPGLGGIANRPNHTNCPNTSTNYGFSSIHTTYDPDLTNYSWSINVIAHEIGHQFSAHHTHDCVWNGNNTQIDDCGNVLAVSQNQNPNVCYDEDNPIIPANAQGTIMSYCHTSGGTGVNLALGFNGQIASRISNFVSSCLEDFVIPPCPIPLAAELSVEVLSPTSISVSSTLPAGNRWIISYAPIDGSSSSICHNGCSTSTTSTSFTITGLDPAKSYQIQAIQYCTALQEFSPWSCPFSVDDLTVITCTTSGGTINSSNANSTIISSADVLATNESIHVTNLNPLTWRAQMSLQLNNETTIDNGVSIEMSVGPCN